MSSPVLVYALETAPFDIAAFVRSEVKAHDKVQYIAEIPPDVDNPLDDDFDIDGRSILCSHPRKEGWGLYICFQHTPKPEEDF